MLSDRYITLKCGTVLRLSDLEAARLSYVPVGKSMVKISRSSNLHIFGGNGVTSRSRRMAKSGSATQWGI